MTEARSPRVLSSVANSDTLKVFVGGDPSVVAMATKAVLLEDADIADDLTVVGDFEVGSTDTERTTFKGFYSATFTVAVPTIADAECDVTELDVSAMTFTPVIGDAVWVYPQAALPTDCVQGAAWVSDTNVVTIGFATKEGGSGVTGANRTYLVVFADLT